MNFTVNELTPGTMSNRLIGSLIRPSKENVDLLEKSQVSSTPGGENPTLRVASPRVETQSVQPSGLLRLQEDHPKRSTKLRFGPPDNPEGKTPPSEHPVKSKRITRRGAGHKKTVEVPPPEVIGDEIDIPQDDNTVTLGDKKYDKTYQTRILSSKSTTRRVAPPKKVKHRNRNPEVKNTLVSSSDADKDEIAKLKAKIEELTKPKDPPGCSAQELVPEKKDPQGSSSQGWVNGNLLAGVAILGLVANIYSLAPSV